MEKPQLEKLRESIHSRLAEIAELTDAINQEMSHRPHKNGATAHLSLKSKNNQYIVDTSKGFTALYHDPEKDELYYISIQKENISKPQEKSL